MTTLRNAYIIVFMPLLLMSVIVNAIYEVPKSQTENKQQAPYRSWSHTNELKQDSKEFNKTGAFSPIIHNNDYEMTDMEEKVVNVFSPVRNNNNDQSFKNKITNNFIQLQVPNIVKQEKNLKQDNVPLHEKEQNNMVPVYNKDDEHKQPISDFDNSSATVNSEDFAKNFQGLVADFRNVEKSSEFDKFLSTIINLYKKHLIIQDEIPSKGSIQMDINFENSYNKGEDVCNVYHLSFQKIYLKPHGFINGSIAGFFNLVGDYSRLGLRTNADYLREKEELKRKYEYCVKQASTVNELKAYNFVKDNNGENTEGKYNSVYSNFGKEENKPAYPNAHPLSSSPVYTLEHLEDNNENNYIGNNGRNILNDPHNSTYNNVQPQVADCGHEHLVNDGTDFYTIRLETGDIKIKKDVTNYVFNYLNWPNTNNTFFSVNVNDTHITGITPLSTFLDKCKNLRDTTYNEAYIKNMITEAGTRKKNAETESRGSAVGNNGSHTLAQPNKNKKSTVNTFDLKLALENLTVAYEKSILINDMKNCKLNKYLLSEAIKMSDGYVLVLSLTLVFSIFLMSLF